MRIQEQEKLLTLHKHDDDDDDDDDDIKLYTTSERLAINRFVLFITLIA